MHGFWKQVREQKELATSHWSLIIRREQLRNRHKMVSWWKWTEDEKEFMDRQLENDV